MEALGAALISPTLVDALQRKMAEGRTGPEGKQDESVEQPESPKEFLDLTTTLEWPQAAGLPVGQRVSLRRAPPPRSAPAWPSARPPFPPHTVMHAGPPYPHSGRPRISSPGLTLPPATTATAQWKAQPTGLSPSALTATLRRAWATLGRDDGADGSRKWGEGVLPGDVQTGPGGKGCSCVPFCMGRRQSRC